MTFFVKMGPGFGDSIDLDRLGLGIWNLCVYDYLELGERTIVQDTSAFDTIIGTICATGVTSQIIFFIWRKFKVGDHINYNCNPTSDPEYDYGEVSVKSSNPEAGIEETTDTYMLVGRSDHDNGSDTVTVAVTEGEDETRL